MTTDFIKGIIYAHISEHMTDPIMKPELDKNSEYLQYPIFRLICDSYDKIPIKALIKVNGTLTRTQLCEDEPTVYMEGFTLVFCPMIPRSEYEDLK